VTTNYGSLLSCGWAADTLRRAVLSELRASAEARADRLAELQREEEKLAGEMLAEWDRAAAAAVFAEAGPLANVHRAESHTTRELHRALALLDRLQARRREISRLPGRPGWPSGWRVSAGRWVCFVRWAFRWPGAAGDRRVGVGPCGTAHDHLLHG
jgi:hypothetical protein